MHVNVLVMFICSHVDIFLLIIFSARNWPCRYCFQTACRLFSIFANSKNSRGATPLHELARLSPDRAKAEDLVRAGATLDITDAFGRTPLACALDTRTREAIEKGAAAARSNGCCVM